MSYHRGNYIGRYSGISDSTRKVVVAALRQEADRAATKRTGHPVGADDWAGGYEQAVIDLIEALRGRADEIEDAGAARWDCGTKVAEDHAAGCSCPKPAPDPDEDHQNELAAREVRAAIGILPS